jgi:hypothetical protein
MEYQIKASFPEWANGEAIYRSHHGLITTNHATSSYDIPVVVIHGQAYGPADLPIGTLLEPSWNYGNSESIACYAALVTGGYGLKNINGNVTMRARPRP